MIARLVMAVLLLGGLLGAAPTAAATGLHAKAAGFHAELIASSPAENASLAAAPARISLTFSEAVTPAANPIEVVGPGNATWQVGKPTLAGAVLSAPVTPNGPAGAYTIVYRVVSADGDAVSGSVPFRLTAAATQPTPSPSPTPTTSSEEAAPPASSEPAPADEPQAEPAAGDGSTLLWVWLLGGAILLAAVVFVTLRVRRPRP